MAVASSEYSKGVFVDSNKDWFHGELSTVQANHALTVSQRDCFLVRVDQGALVLSLSHHGQLHHIKIKYGPGWYELESGSAQYSFTELEELVTHYSETAISGLKVTLGEVCHKTGSDPFYETISDISHSYETISEATPHHYDYISNNIYSKGEPEDQVKYKWYHGNITQDQADAALGMKGHKFLVRRSADRLYLSQQKYGRIYHTLIHYSPQGYQLEGNSQIYSSVPQMVAHQQQFLGAPVETVPSDLQVKLPKNIFQKGVSSLRVSWKRCADLPIAIATPHVVSIGEDVYAGGGVAQIDANMKDCVFKYNIGQDAWTPLPPCKTTLHGLTTLHGELIAVGGQHSNGQETNDVCTFRDSDWIKVLPQMPTPRRFPSTISHDNKIIVAAGGTEGINDTKVNTVEVYIHSKQAWYTSSHLLFPLVQFITCKIEDTLFALGGTGNVDLVAKTLYTTTSSLLENSEPTDSRYSTPQLSTTWNQLQGTHPLIFSTPVELAGRLVAMGGTADPRLRRGTSFISTYDFATDIWVECKGAALPTPLYRPGVLKLDDTQVMIVGGQPKMQQFSTAVYIGSYETTAHHDTTTK